MDKDVNLISQPIFLVGAERSGTTLLRLMLDHHPQIAFDHEFEYAVDLIRETSHPDIQDYYDFLETDRIFQNSGFEIDFDLDYPQLVNSFLVQKQKRDDKPIVGATVHRHFDRLLTVWPDAKFIHILRDPRDVARSCIGMNWAGNVWSGVERWLEAEKLWAQLKNRISPEQRIEVRYESLISEPVASLERLCEFMGTSYDSGMLSYPDHTTYSLPEAKFVAQWKRKLSPKEIQLVEARVGKKMLEDRGYELSQLPALHVSQTTEQKLRLHNRWSVVKGRINTYGFPLVLSGYLSRRLGLKQWEKNIQLKCNLIDSSKLK